MPIAYILYCTYRANWEFFSFYLRPSCQFFSVHPPVTNEKSARPNWNSSPGSRTRIALKERFPGRFLHTQKTICCFSKKKKNIQNIGKYLPKEKGEPFLTPGPWKLCPRYKVFNILCIHTPFIHLYAIMLRVPRVYNFNIRQKKKTETSRTRRVRFLRWRLRSMMIKCSGRGTHNSDGAEETDFRDAGAFALLLLLLLFPRQGRRVVGKSDIYTPVGRPGATPFSVRGRPAAFVHGVPSWRAVGMSRTGTTARNSSPPPGAHSVFQPANARVPATPLRQWVLSSLFNTAAAVPIGIFPRANYTNSSRFFFFISSGVLFGSYSLSLFPHSCSHYNRSNGNGFSLSLSLAHRYTHHAVVVVVGIHPGLYRSLLTLQKLRKSRFLSSIFQSPSKSHRNPLSETKKKNLLYAHPLKVQPKYVLSTDSEKHDPSTQT